MDATRVLCLILYVVGVCADNGMEDRSQYLRKSVIGNINLAGHISSSISKAHENVKSGLFISLCNFLPCSDWSEWTSCDSVVGRYGTQNRLRECGQNVSEICKENTPNRNKDSRKCMIDIPWCHLEFEYTRHGYCIKLFNESFLSWYDAQIACSELGGSLINIDEENKYNDIQEAFKSVSFTSIYAWVDGIKFNANEYWNVERGSRKPVTFGTWFEGAEENKIKFPQCRGVIRKSQLEPLMWCVGNVCENRENYICEKYKK
ncbi:hypothetical protein ACF0H5_019346 [Mactra antiquata]